MYQKIYVKGKLVKCKVSKIEYELLSGYYIVHLIYDLEEYIVRVWKGLEEEWDRLLDRWIFVSDIESI